MPRLTSFTQQTLAGLGLNRIVFNIGTGFNNSVLSIVPQPDGKILVGGEFTDFNGNTRNRLVRLNSDGTEDTDFYTNLGTGFGSTVRGIALQSDGKILVVGSYTAFNGNTRNRLVRLNSDGTEDTAFYTNLGTGFNDAVNVIALQSDGKILVGGDFGQFNGAVRNRLMRFNADLTVDTAFSANLGSGPSGEVRAIALQSDGKILVGGFFGIFDGTLRLRLVRLNTDGTEDTAFYTNLGNSFSSAVLAIALQSDGKILVGGEFTDFNGNTRNGLVRLNADGTEDTDFYTNLGTGFDDNVTGLAVQSDGKILVNGVFTDLNGNTRNGLVRLNADGTEDTAFYTNLGTGFNSGIGKIVERLDGRILVGGGFTTFNGNTRNRLVLLNSNGIEVKG